MTDAVSVRDSISAAIHSEVTLLDAVSVVIATAPIGYLMGFLFTVHLAPSETMAVWLTTIVLSVLGLVLWSVRS